MRVVLSGGVLALLLVGSVARAEILEEFTVKDWSGLAVADEQTGGFSSCAIYSKYQNGATLFLIKHVDGGWAVSLVHPDWALAENGSYPVKYRVDRLPYVEDSGAALGVDQFGLTFSDDDPLIAQIRRGTLLTVLFEGKEYGFELANSGKALQAAKECVERRRDTVSPRIALNEGLADTAPDRMLPREPVANAPVGGAELLSSETPDDLDANQRQEIGPWVVSATRDEAGQFLNCTAFVVRGDDQLMLSHYPDEFWDISLYRASWALDTNQTYALFYNVDAPIDGPGAIVRSVEASETTRIVFEVPNAEAILQRVERGRELRVELRGEPLHPQIFQFRLDRAADAFAATRECTRRNAHGT